MAPCERAVSYTIHILYIRRQCDALHAQNKFAIFIYKIIVMTILDTPKLDIVNIREVSCFDLI